MISWLMTRVLVGRWMLLLYLIVFYFLIFCILKILGQNKSLRTIINNFTQEKTENNTKTPQYIKPRSHNTDDTKNSKGYYHNQASNEEGKPKPTIIHTDTISHRKDGSN